jgi:hypothetical protein
MAERKAVYLRMHPETKKGATGRAGKNKSHDATYKNGDEPVPSIH